MQKVQQSSSGRLQSYISEFKDILSSDGHILFCKLCEIKIVSEKRFNVIQHLTNIIKQLSEKKIKKKVSQQLVSNINSGKKIPSTKIYARLSLIYL